MLLWPLLLALSTCISAFSAQEKALFRNFTREIWNHGYSNYMDHAFPADENLPLTCQPVSYDYADVTNRKVNDVMGDYVLQLVDILDTFVVFNDKQGFEDTVRQIISHVNFDKDVTVQVFEVSIRIMGGLLSGHQFATHENLGFRIPWYNNELLHLAQDLGTRLLPAFETKTRLPYARINLRRGVVKKRDYETCSAGAGSLVLEFGTLSRLTGDPRYEEAAKAAFFAIWERRTSLNIIGNTISVDSGHWLTSKTSIGAGIDSFFEYAAKAYVLFQDDEYLKVWDIAYEGVMSQMRSPDGYSYRAVDLDTGLLLSYVTDSLSAFFPSIQVLMGDLDAGIKSHLFFAFQWLRYHGIPETFDTYSRAAVHAAYPLRPELVESNYYLYLATGDPFYQDLAALFLHDINQTRVSCGLAAVKDLVVHEFEDMQPSFALSETLKYLYLTFDEDNVLNKIDSPAVFSTEGHFLFPVRSKNPPAPVDKSYLARFSDSVYSRLWAASPATLHTCPVAPPESANQGPLTHSVSSRRDIDFAMHLVGFLPAQLATYSLVHPRPDFAPQNRSSALGASLRSISLVTQSSHFVCDAPESEELAVDVAFSELIGTTARHTATPVARTKHNDILISALGDLRISLSRRTTDALPVYRISRAGDTYVPNGNDVYVTDPKVLKSIPPSVVSALYKINILGAVYNNENRLKSGFRLDTAAATFNPPLESYAEHMKNRLFRFSATESMLDLHIPPNPDDPENFHEACEVPEDCANWSRSAVLIGRGTCNFAIKALHAAMCGANLVLVANMPDSEFVTPSASQAELNALKATRSTIPPVFLIKYETALELARHQTLYEPPIRISALERIDINEPIAFAGYLVNNLKLRLPDD